ncbi:MAG: helix-turn-helix domain-containing protein [Victivallaceae bacterium]
MIKTTIFLTFMNNIDEIYEKLEQSGRLGNLSESLAAAPAMPTDINVSVRRRDTAVYFQQAAHRWYILWLCVEGLGELMVEGTLFRLRAGEFLVVFPGQPHRRISTTAENCKWILVRFHLAAEPDWIESFRNAPASYQESGDLLRVFLDQYIEAERTRLPEMVTECGIRLALLLNGLRTASPPGGAHLPEPDDPRLLAACRMLSKNFADGEAEGVTARMLGMSEAHLRRLFKERFGVTPHRFLNQYRMLTAQHMLLHTTRTVSEIGKRCGFQSIYAFSRFFAGNSGVSPLQYRKRWKK